jgi:hypothetical protein
MTSENMSQESSATQSTGTESAGSTQQSQTSTGSIPGGSGIQSAVQSAVNNAQNAGLMGSDGTTPAAPIYQPNYKFKAFDKEYEIEEAFRPFIKDENSEKAFRKIHEKAYAMERFKEDRERLKKEYDGFKETTEPNMQAYNHFNNLLKNKDWDNLFGGLKVPKEEIFGWVEKQLKIMNAAPEEQAAYEQQNRIRQENYYLQQQMEQQSQMFQTQAVQTRTMQLEGLLSRGDVASKAQDYDSKTGQIGSFRNLVVEEASAHWHRTGEDLAADQAVQRVLSRFAPFFAGSSGSQSQTQGFSGQEQMSQGSNSPPPIIPHVAGRSSSPVKKVPRSLDELRALSKQAQA